MDENGALLVAEGQVEVDPIVFDPGVNAELYAASSADSGLYGAFNGDFVEGALVVDRPEKFGCVIVTPYLDPDGSLAGCGHHDRCRYDLRDRGMKAESIHAGCGEYDAVKVFGLYLPDASIDIAS